ncbi:MAG: hypothetical protein ACJ768_09410 [Gaiellaceae bacterium]
MKSSQLAPGLLVLMLGVFLISRTITKDDTGRTLIDRALGKPGSTPAAAAALAAGGAGIVSDTAAPLPVHDLPHGAPGRVVRRPLPRHRPSPATHDLPHGAPGATVRR